jgi:hypothetical protein
MFELPHEEMLDMARSDQKARSKQHAQHCILLAVVTGEELAAELIDKAIALHADDRLA